MTVRSVPKRATSTPISMGWVRFGRASGVRLRASRSNRDLVAAAIYPPSVPPEGGKKDAAHRPTRSVIANRGLHELAQGQAC